MRNVGVWGLAVVITLGAAVYQRLTGPTHPLRGSASIAGDAIRFRLPRSHGGEGGPTVAIELPRDASAELVYRRYPTNEPWTRISMQRDEATVSAALPHQPPAGKLEYFIAVRRGSEALLLPPKRTAVIRFKGHVPLGILIPHVLFMFVAMLFSNAAGVEAALTGERMRRYASVAVGCLAAGGLVLGPIVQKLAFGDLWTGIPFGYDLTDNKTLIAALVWGAALWATYRRPLRQSRWWVLAGATMLLAVYSIPHSALGSQLNPETGVVETGG